MEDNLLERCEIPGLIARCNILILPLLLNYLDQWINGFLCAKQTDIKSNYPGTVFTIKLSTMTNHRVAEYMYLCGW